MYWVRSHLVNIFSALGTRQLSTRRIERTCGLVDLLMYLVRLYNSRYNILAKSSWPHQKYVRQWRVINPRYQTIARATSESSLTGNHTFDNSIVHEENFMAIFTTLSVVIWFSTGTLGIFATLVYVFTMRVVINEILSMAIIPTLSTSILFCNLYYILLWISPRSVVKIAIRI